MSPEPIAHPTDLEAKSQKRNIRPLALIAIITAACRMPDFFLPVSRDSGLFAYGGWRILHGALPYKDFWDNKLPGVFYIDALAIRLFGPSTYGLVIFQMIYVAITAMVFYATIRRFCRPAGAFLTTVLFAFYHGSYGLSDGGNYTETYIALPALLAVLLLLNLPRPLPSKEGKQSMSSRDKERKRFLSPFTRETTRGYTVPFLVGALVALAALIKQPAGLLLVAMALFILFGDRRRRDYASAGMIILGACSTAILTVAWMAHKGILSDAIDANLVFNKLYFEDSYTGYLPAILLNLLRGMILVALPLIGAIGGAISLVLRRAPLAWLLVPWFVLDLAGLAMGGRFYNHYFLVILPSTFILTGILIDTVCRSRKATILTAVAGLILFIGPVWKYENTANPELKELPVCSIAEREYHAINWIANRRLQLGVQLPAEEIASWIKDHTDDSDMIYVWGWETRIAFLALRPFPTRYLHTHPLGATGFDRATRIRELARDLKKRRPKYIVDDSALMPTTAPPLDPSQPVPKQFSKFFRLDGYEPVQEVVAKYYKPVAIVGGCIIYEAR